MAIFKFRCEGSTIHINYDEKCVIRSAFLDAIEHTDDSVIDLQMTREVLCQLKTYIETGLLILSSPKDARQLKVLIDHCNHLVLLPMPEIIDPNSFCRGRRSTVEHTTLTGAFPSQLKRNTMQTIDQMEFRHCAFSFVELQKSIVEVRFTDCLFNDCKFGHIQFVDVAFVRCTFVRCDFKVSELPGIIDACEFEECDLTLCHYAIDAQMTMNRFKHCFMRGFDVQDNRRQSQVQRSYNNFDYCDLSGAVLDSFVSSTCIGCILSDTVIQHLENVHAPLKPTNPYRSTQFVVIPVQP